MPFRARALALSFGFAITTLLGVLPGTTLEPAAAAAKKVAIIVGPTGPMTGSYRDRADDIAVTAAAAGADVVKVYSPNATWRNVRAAVNGANLIVYLGHGNGSPNPYSSSELTDRVNGWGLNRIAGVDAADPTGDGDNYSTNMVYCGEKALLGTLGPGDGSAQLAYCTGGPVTPAPNFVMVYSNACYAPGAGETRPAPSEDVAVSRVANYSTPILRLGGTYIATDLGADTIVDLVLRSPTTPLGRIVELGNGFDPNALRRFAHADGGGAEVWVQRTTNQWLGEDYWYAFAGDPGRTPNGGSASYAAPAPAPAPAAPFSDISDSKFYEDILWLADTGITSGCGSGRFCPDGVVTRSQMASFLSRALSLPATTRDYFADDNGNKHEDNINRLAAAGITSGCADRRFCPDGAVARDQMGSFLKRALDLPGSSVNWFSDDNGNKHESAINAIATADVTRGCGGDRYCPAGAVTRGQMAAFLHRAFGD